MLHRFLKVLVASVMFSGIMLGFAQGTPNNTAVWTWTAPTTYTDGTAIPSTVTITYNLYTGPGPGKEATTPTQVGISGLTVTTNGYADGSQVCGTLTAVAGGLESAHTNEVCKTFPLPAPAAPTGLAVQ